MNPTPELPVLPYGTISPEFENLLTATVNKVEREWPSKWRAEQGAQYIVESVARVTLNTHMSVRFLCAQEPPDPKRKVEYALSVGPTIRSLTDTVFLLAFLFEDVPRRASLYLKGGWKEWSEEFARYLAVYGQNPSWQEWLSTFSDGLAMSKSIAGITDSEASDPKSLQYWPTPGQMLRDKSLKPETKELFAHLNDWYYRTFSSYSHLSWPGLVMRSSGLRPAHGESEEAVKAWRLDKQRSDAVAMDIVLSLAAMSEIEGACRFGLATRLRYVWGILAAYYGLADELFRLRYDVLLTV